MITPSRRPSADRRSTTGFAPRRTPRGIALVLVLWIILLLTVMALSLTAALRTQGALARNQTDSARFRAAADAAINLTALDLLGNSAEPDATEAAWLPDGIPRILSFDGAVMTLVLTNEASRIDLNEADRDQLLALLDIVLPQEEDSSMAQSDAIADAILDWRDEDDMALLNGAEDDDYEAAGLPYGAGDEPFTSVEQLMQVLGMTPQLYHRLAPNLTVSNPGGQVDEQFASAPVLAALRGGSLEEAQEDVARRNQPIVPGAEPAAPLGRGGPLYRLNLQMASSPGGLIRRMEALFEIQQQQDPPLVVHWRRYGQLGSLPVLPAADDSERTD